ncbi:hypothetical protein BL250_14970 [Erwinia sp. OLTSP20]|uniref:DUF3053 domain-containing protein n=1 Tax=unclassified Erwinia TaxID=2622719 RepID=UPI000C18091A|nr:MULTISPECIES: DUF3053 domain-containing protein [unclassified Erwinia]PIJ48282.1 hypothetical protein BV501_17640 [Erwinia sp. OAMSP11]PIJ68868.1 hypothetical protein BK416_15905 [Erwinia sp. OLSSP12]PIJ80088.1 hypothetical protein BLD46_16090 [Erwinia sp. OLMTSP26]PIJ81541.1 hypothetical protein BLD49_16395 [Erwinia sp. OLMDSP33]PIJ82709.1 hypothetical protein BLD47_06305 [Erwinia sp. OLCASP19]
MKRGISRLHSAFLLSLLLLASALILSGCGDKTADQRKAFIDFLQNTIMRSGERIPALSEDQKQKFGPYVTDYAILYGFAQQVSRAKQDGIQPVVAELTAIRLPQDYITHRDSLRQASGALGVLSQQLQSAKSQADSSKAGLKQPDDLKPLYEKAYNQIVTQPASQLLPLLPGLQSLSQSAVQAGDFLQQQGNNVTLNGVKVKFSSQQQVDTYNGLMNALAQNSQVLSQAQKLQ